MSLAVVILAAGKGTRMNSDLPKVLHPLAGVPLLAHVIKTAKALNPEEIHVVVGHGADQVEAVVADQGVQFVTQEQQLGTGHAVDQAISKIRSDQTLVLYGDVPLTRSETLQDLLELQSGSALSILTVKLADPTGYGRIVRDDTGAVKAIVEQKDADPETLTIDEGNTGILCANTVRLKDWLSQLDNDNQQGEYYLTDCIAACVSDGDEVSAQICNDETEVLGVNDKLQLHQLEREVQYHHAAELMQAGVTLMDADRIDVRGRLTCGKDVTIDINCVFIGDVALADGVSIGPNCVIENSFVGVGSKVLANCVLENAQLDAGVSAGPFARLRPGAVLNDGAKVGNFVEIKKSEIGKGSKVSHLSYIGDAELGEEVNIGAGTITCNYDGVNKHKTKIGDKAFIGSNSSLVAPIGIGAEATVGAGSTLGSDAPEGQLTIERNKQRSIAGWKRPVKKQD